MFPCGMGVLRGISGEQNLFPGTVRRGAGVPAGAGEWPTPHPERSTLGVSLGWVPDSLCVRPFLMADVDDICV